MEGHCSTGQSPQWAVVPMEEVFKSIPQIHDWKQTQQFMLGEGVDKQLIRDVDGVNPRDLPGSSADNSNDMSFCIARYSMQMEQLSRYSD
jgi:hypothetical protein